MRALGVGLAACLLLAGCSAQPPAGPGDSGVSATAGNSSSSAATVEGRVDVDTPALRALKAKALVQTCRPGTATGGLPAVTLPCLGGGPSVDLSTLRGPTVINLFAQWCGPCRAELPYYQALHVKAKGRVRVLGIDYLDTQPLAALELARRAGVTYPLLADPSGTLRSGLGIRGLPGVVLLDAHGKVTDVEFRVFRSYTELRALVRRKLGLSLPA